jgi:hypothetical protein
MSSTNNSLTYTTSEFRAILSRRENPWRDRLHRLDVRMVHGLARHSLALLRVSAALVFLWAGLPKLIPGLSPAEPLISASLPGFSMALLAALEIAIALSFVVRPFLRALLPLLLAHLLGALLVMALGGAAIFRVFPFVLTLEGQFLAFSLIVFSAGLVVAATARGGGLTSEPDALATARRVEQKAE